MPRLTGRPTLAALLAAVTLASPVGPATVAAAEPGRGDRGPDLISPPSRERATRVPAAPAPPAESILVQYRPGAAAAAVRQAAHVERVRPGHARGLELVRPIGRSIAAALRALRADPDVAHAEPDVRRTLAVDPTAEPLFGLQWGLDNTGQTINGYPGVANVDIDAAQAYALTTGDPNLVVAVIDDGVDFGHPDLAGREWVNAAEAAGSAGIDDDANGYIDDVHGWDFCNDDPSVHDVDEDHHGTAVASVIAASANGTGMTGVAPGVRVMALKFLDDDHTSDTGGACGTVSQELAAIAYARSFGIRIANASYSGSDYSQFEKDAIDGSGMLFVAAAGNSAHDIDLLPEYPAAYTSANILSVAAIHNQGGLTDFTNYGDAAVDVAAPGEDIVVAVPGTFSHAPDWGLADGTSFAAPHVAGAAALLASGQTALLGQPAALRQRIVDTSWGSAPGFLAHGVVDALFALDAPSVGAPSPSLVTPATLGTSTATVRIAWPVAADDDGVAGYELQQRPAGGSWTTVATGTSAGAVNRSLAIGSSYQFRLLAADTQDNEVVATTAPFRVLRYQESSSAVDYRGTWYRWSATSASGGRTKYTSRAGNWARFRFTGSGVAYVAPKSRTRGSARIYIDGTLVKTVSLYSATSRSRQVLYSRSWPSVGSHSIRVLVVGTRGRPRVDVDAFVILR